MNLKKTLGSVLLAAALVASGFAGARPVQAATTGFVKPLILDKCVLPVQSNEGDSVTFKLQATDPSGKRTVKDGIVQFRLWVENLSTKEWTEVSKGYTSPILLGKEQALTVSGLKAGDYKTVAWVRYASAASAFAAFDAEHATYRTGTLTVKVADAYAQLLQKATDAVTAYETAVGKIDKTNPTQAQIDAANAVKKTIDLTGLKDADKTALQARIDAADKLIPVIGQTGTVTISVVTSPVMSSLKDITISSTIANAAMYKLDGFDAVKLGSATRTFAASNPIAITLLAADGKTVVATGTIDTTKTEGTVTLASTPTPAKVTATAKVVTSPVMSSLKDITVTVSGADGAKYQIDGFGVTASGSATRTFAAPATAKITIFAADGTTVLATGTIDTTTGVVTLN